MRRYEEPKLLKEMTQDERVRFYLRVHNDFHYFNEVVLGYHDMNDEHYELCKFLQNNPKRFKLAMMPRFTFKSCVCTQGMALWRLVKDPNFRLLIYSDSAGKAQGFLLGIKNHIEGKANSRFREFFKGWETDPHKGKWNESQIVVSKRDKAHVEPSVDTGGIESSKVGMHFDMIIFDDIVSDVNVTTKDQMDKTHNCYKKSLSLLKPKGEVLMVGTRWHFGDAYGRILAENDKTGTFGVFIRSAVVGDKYLFDNCGENSLTQEFLEHQKREQGSYVWSCLYQNSPVDDETALFKYKDFGFYQSLKKSNTPHVTGMYENLYITGTLDPAGEGEDGTAGTVVGTDAGMRMYVLELFCKQSCTPSEMVDWVIKMNKKYHFRRFGVETTFFRGMLKKDLEARIRDESKDPFFHRFGIEEFKTRWRKGEGKRIRIESLQPYHERGDILFPGEAVETLRGEFSDLAYQMMQVTRNHMPEPNDLLDALSWQVDLVQRGGMPEQDGPPKNSPAELELRWIEQHNRLQRRLPRGRRRVWEPSLS